MCKLKTQSQSIEAAVGNLGGSVFQSWKQAWVEAVNNKREQRYK